MEYQQPKTFTISTKQLHFSQPEQSLKLTIKNISLRTTSYQINIGDQQHFQISTMNSMLPRSRSNDNINSDVQSYAYRMFSLAPGISKSIVIRHVCGSNCSLRERQILKAFIRDCNGSTAGFECRCPKFQVYQQKQIIEFVPQVELGQFDQKTNFAIQIKNVGHKNIKIIFEQPLKVPENQGVNSASSSNNNILLFDALKKLQIKCLSNDSIIMIGESLKFQFELNYQQHGKLQENLQFCVVAEDGQSSKKNKKKEVIFSNQANKKYSIKIQGYSVSKKLIIKDELKQVVNQIRNELLTGTNKSSYFFIQTQYHQEMPYRLQAYLQCEKPQIYSQKWDNLSINFINGQTGQNQRKNSMANMSSGILYPNKLNKIEYKVQTKYSVNDENYVTKYAKIQFDDDANALRMRNSEFAKKYEDMEVKIVLKIVLNQKDKQKIKTVRSLNKTSLQKQDIVQSIIPFKFTLINPSLRCQIADSQQNVTTITVFNQTKIQIPFKFPQHSLYRILASQTSNNCTTQNAFFQQSQNNLLAVNKKQDYVIKWTKQKQRCPIYMEIPGFDLVLYQPAKNVCQKDRSIILLPATRRRPQTSISSAINAKEKQIKISNNTNENGLVNKTILQKMASQPSFNCKALTLTRPSSVYPLQPNLPSLLTGRNNRPQTPTSRPLSSMGCGKKCKIMKQIPANILAHEEQYIANIQDMAYLIQFQKILKNTHPTAIFVVQIIGIGFLVLKPQQFFVFQTVNASLAISFGQQSLGQYKYRLYGHNPVYRVKINQDNENIEPFQQLNKSKIKNQLQPNSPHSPRSGSHSAKSRSPRGRELSNFYQMPAYQILTRQIRMSFKNSKQQFQIIEPILIKNCSDQQIQINCISIDGQFFKCKENGGILVVPPGQIGKFKIAFQPQNSVRLSIMNKQPPRQFRRKAIVKSDHEITLKQNSTTVRKSIKLLISKTTQIINCIGQLIQKSCSVKPYNVSFTNCKYGSPQILETLIITNTSQHKINFIIDHPSQISIRPKTGSIQPKCTQNFVISFKPCKKIANFTSQIRVYIGGSHLQLIPLFINVEDPQIFIKQPFLSPNQNQNAIYVANHIQELNLQMTIINNNPSQSFIEIDLRNTPLYLGFTKNYHSASSGLVIENFVRCSQIIEDSHDIKTYKNINNDYRLSYNENSLKSIVSQQNSVIAHQALPTNEPTPPQKCSLTLSPNTFLIVPLTLRLVNPKIGLNTVSLPSPIATLIGFGELKSPSHIQYNCNKTLLHISPCKLFNEIVITQSQRCHQIGLTNMGDREVRVWTKIRHHKQKTIQNNSSSYSEDVQDVYGDKAKRQSELDSSIVCTFKDIDQYLKPQSSIDLIMSFICFDAEKQTVKSTYQLSIYVQQISEQNSSKQQINLQVSPYFTTTISVVVPEPFLQISPSTLVMPTVGINMWSRQSFFIRNNGYKQIFVKIKKPANILFQMETQIISSASQGNSKSKISAKNSGHLNRPSLLTQKERQGSQSPSYYNSQKLLQNQLTKINNSLEIRVSIRSKSKISFNCILQIQDNFNKKYEMTFCGTCTDSPLFVQDGAMGAIGVAGIGGVLSASSFNSHHSFCSQKSFTSSVSSYNNKDSRTGVFKKSNLQPTDIQDILFLNNWIGSLIPQISNQSTFFYVWLTKIDNLLKFLNQFKVNLSFKRFTDHQNKTTSKQKQERNSISQKDKNIKKLTLTSILQDLKQQGFQLNSLRIQLLQKADQLEWLNFMWFFLSKALISPNFLSWISKNTTRQSQQISYSYVLKNFQQILTILMTTILQLKKQSNNNKSIDWKYLLQNFQSLLQNFKHIESRRHLILSLNIIYHKLSSVRHQIIEIFDFDFVLNVQNTHNRKVRYFLQCNPKHLTCEQSSNKILPSETAHGYSFMSQESDPLILTFSIKNYAHSAISTVMTKNIIDLMNVIMFNNVIWDPITIYHIKLKKKQDIVHEVNIQCENRSVQQWVWKFQSKMSAQHRVFFQVGQQSNESLRLLSGQPGYLKKGESTTIRVIYSPESMNKSQATLKIINTMVKQVFKIHGKPLHSSKIQFQKNLKIIQNDTHTQIVTIPWENAVRPNLTMNRIGLTSKIQQTATGAIGNSSGMKQTTSTTSRQNNPMIYKSKDAACGQSYILKLYNPATGSSINIQPGNKSVSNQTACPTQSSKYLESLLSSSFAYNQAKKQLSLTLCFKYAILLRNLEMIFQISNSDNTQSKLIRLVVDVVPRPITILAEIQTQYGSPALEMLKLANISKNGAETVKAQYGYIPANIFNKQTSIADQKDEKAKQPEYHKILSNYLASLNPHSNSGSGNTINLLQNIHKGLFQVIKIKNNQNILFVNKQHKTLEYVEVGVKYYPNENNCYYNNSCNGQNREKLQTNNGGANQKTRSLQPTKKKTNSRNNSYVNQLNSETMGENNSSLPLPTSEPSVSNYTQLPYFYLSFTYNLSQYHVTYLFKPSIKKPVPKIASLLVDNNSLLKKDIVHQCLPLKKYFNNLIEIQNLKESQVVFQVETDLYQISGKNQITVKPRSSGKYYYDIYCLHLGRKQGKIKFKQQHEPRNQLNKPKQIIQQAQYNVIINISQSVKCQQNAVVPSGGSNQMSVPKGSCQQDGLRIYNQYFEITSTIRKPKIFSIFLANMSNKQIQYEIHCSSQYLHPLIHQSVQGPKTISIAPNCQYQLQIQYLPYFVGKEEARLRLYNPHQPEITYQISMISEDSIETIVKQMPAIGENGLVELQIIRPLSGSNIPNFFNNKSRLKDKQAHNENKEKRKKLEQLQLSMELTELILNGHKIQPNQYHNFMKIFEQSTQGSRKQENDGELASEQPASQAITNPISNRRSSMNRQSQPNCNNGNGYKFILKFGSSSANTPITGNKLLHQNMNINMRKLYLLFITQKLQLKYQYELTFFSNKYGHYRYKVIYKYPVIQKAEEKIIYVDANDESNQRSAKMIKMMCSKSNKHSTSCIQFTVPFVNKFNEQLQLRPACPPHIKLLKILAKSSNFTSQTVGPDKICVPAFAKLQLTFQILLQSVWKSSHLIREQPQRRQKCNSQFQLQLKSNKFQTFTWVYPITFYKVFQASSILPVAISGEARMPISIKIYPLIAYRVSRIEVIFDHQRQKQRQSRQIQHSDNQIQVKLKQDIIRKRIQRPKKVANTQSQFKQQGKNPQTQIQSKPHSSYLQTLNSADRLVPSHSFLDPLYLYQVELEINTLTAMKNQGYIYLYQNQDHIHSKNISPNVSEKMLFKKQNQLQDYQQAIQLNNKAFQKKQQLGYFVQKIPFMLRIEPPKIELLQFQANVGEKSTIKLKLSNLSNQNADIKSKQSSLTPKVLDFILSSVKPQIKIQLHNNKCRQFSACFNESEGCIEVTYFAQEYSGLKKGRLEIVVDGVYSQYELIGKFPKKDNKDNSRANSAIKRTSKAIGEINYK